MYFTCKEAEPQIWPDLRVTRGWMIWGMLLNDIEGTFCFHEFTQHTGTLTEHKTPQKWNSFAHFPPSSHLLPMVRQLQPNEISPCSYASVDASHSKKYTWNMTQFVPTCQAIHWQVLSEKIRQDAKSCSSQSGPTARAGLTSLHSAQKAEQLAANQFEPLRTIHNHAPQREFEREKRSGGATCCLLSRPCDVINCTLVWTQCGSVQKVWTSWNTWSIHMQQCAQECLLLFFLLF